jgi:hypothetical protein
VFAADEGRVASSVGCVEAAFAAGEAANAPRSHGVVDAFEAMFTKVFVLERVAEQSMRGGRDDDLVGAGELLQSRGDIRGFADRGTRHRGVAGAALADHDRAGGNANANVKRLRARQPVHRSDDLKGRAHGTLGVVLVRLREAEVHDQPVA